MKNLARSTAIIGLWGLAWGSAGEAQAGKAPAVPFHYHYVDVSSSIPYGYWYFDAWKLTNDEHDYGTLWSNECDSNGCPYAVAVYSKGTITVLQQGLAYSANQSGTVGGSVLLNPPIDPIAGGLNQQAALFKGSRVERIPFLPHEHWTHVTKITDSGIAAVAATELVDIYPYDLPPHLYKGGKVTPLNLGPGAVININNVGHITELFGGPAYILDPTTGKKTILNPLPTETTSWSASINDNDEVLGWSWTPGGSERVGVWNKNGVFSTYFLEGIPAYSTISKTLYRNSQGLIVITNTNDNNSYIVPQRDQRINLADVTDANFPFWSDIYGVNDNGDMIGVGGPFPYCACQAFLLQRVPGALASAPRPSVKATAKVPRLTAARQKLLREWLRRRGVG